MDGVLALITSASGADADLRTLESQLREQEDAIRSHLRGNNCQAMAAALAQLHSAQYSLGLLYLFHAQSHVLAEAEGPVFLTQVKGWLLECDGQQIRHSPKLFTTVCKKCLTIATAIGNRSVMSTIRPLMHAADALAPNPNCLTPVHADVLQACLLSSCYHMGRRFLDTRPIFSVNPSATSLTSADYLRYFYYAGMVAIGLKSYAEAMDYLQTCVTASATALSAIAVEAYKKMVLCSLVLKGAKPTLPKYTSSAVSRNLKPCAATYNELAEKFISHDAATLGAAMEAATPGLTRDHNLGLAKQASAALVRWKIELLTGTYVTLPIDGIVQRTGAADAADVERHLLTLVESGELAATLDQRLAMVHFRSDDSAFELADASQQFQAAMGTLMAMSERVVALDASISANPQYLSKTTSDCPSPLGAAPHMSSWDASAAPMLGEFE